METLVTVIHILVALFMILVVLVQGGNQGGIGAAFGGGNTQGVFGAAGATTFLGKLTYGAAIIFMMTSISLTILQGTGGNVGFADKLKRQQTDHKADDEADEHGAAEEKEPKAPAAGEENAVAPEAAAPGSPQQDSQHGDEGGDHPHEEGESHGE